VCGIAGIIDQGAGFGRNRLRAIAQAMRDTMVHRGPDDAGLWVDEGGRCALAHRRLSIIDLSPDARQPMGNEDGSVLVTFNGEIYNFQELRRALEADGHRFRSKSDSEVLPHLFESLDAAKLHDLDGMFAFGLWHRARQRLLLARDPFGKKPLYYAQGQGWFAFASELQALACIPGFNTTVDRDSLALYLFLQYIPAPWTIYRGAQKLPPGSYLELDCAVSSSGEPSVQRYATFEARESDPRTPRTDAENAEELREIVLEAVRKRLISDVPIGAFLSGGVDSSLVVAMITQELRRPVKTYSIGFEGTGESEHLFARQVADHLGTEHHEQLLKADALELVAQIATMLDEPNGDSSCLPMFLLCQYTRQFVTVALSGDGGDEMFGGYGRYRDTLLESRWFARASRSLRAGRWMTPADSYLSPRWLMFQPQEVHAFLGDLSPAISDQLESWRKRLNDSRLPLLHRMRNLDVATYLPGAVLTKVDRMSMQVSLEVRSPLLDLRVARFAQTASAATCWQPPDDTKRILKGLAGKYLPESWMRRKKMGFGLPSNAWSREAILEFAKELLLSPSGHLIGLIDRATLQRHILRQTQPGSFSVYQMWPLLILELWLRKVHITGSGPD
jgi:asparagine synthase (glutamine-hydrolysing)